MGKCCDTQIGKCSITKENTCCFECDKLQSCISEGRACEQMCNLHSKEECSSYMSDKIVTIITGETEELNKDLHAEIDTLKEELKLTKIKLDKAQEELRTAKAKVDDVHVENLEQELDDLKFANNLLREEVNLHKNKVADTIEENSILKKELELYKTKYSTLKAMICDFINKL